MKLSEFKSLIREEIKQSLQEAHYTSRTYISNLEQAWDGPVDAYDDLNNFFADVKQHPDVYGDYKAWAKQIAKVLQKYK
jgi:hypothetical protein